MFFDLVKLQFGEVGLVWDLFQSAPRLVRVHYSEESHGVRGLIQKQYSGAKRHSHSVIDDIRRQLQEYDRGADVRFSFPDAGLQHKSLFFRCVWAETCRIKRGNVSTYGQIAENIGHPRAARAVGTALAANPFPLLVPCHRVVPASGKLGNYSGGGPEVKRRLLEREGLGIDCRGRVFGLPQAPPPMTL